jgi:chromosome partitioning protein
MRQTAGMLVLSVVSLKGGVGKTTVSLGMSGAAAVRGLRTLLVDLDPQANATEVMDVGNPPFTVNDVLADARPGVLRDAITPSGWHDRLDVVASEPALEHRNSPTDGRGGEHRLRTAMTGLTDYDLVVVDSPPSLGELTKNALAASHRALVVAEPTLFALTGAQQALRAIDVVRRGFNLRLRPGGVVVNRFRARSTEHRFRLDELVENYGPLVLEPVLPERTALTQAQGAHVPIQAWGTPGAREAAAIMDGYLTAIMADAAGPDVPLTV